MRVTKAVLLHRLAAAEAFQQCEFFVVDQASELHVKDMIGYVSPAQYTSGQVPMRNEIGRVGNVRFLNQKIPRWKKDSALRRMKADLLAEVAPSLIRSPFDRGRDWEA